MSCSVAPPKNQENICSIFLQKPNWYDNARKSEKKWGTPISTLLAFVKQESSYRKNARPAFKWFLFIPLGRPSSAKGYAQAQNPVWKDYKKERRGIFKSRSNMSDALDFIGWYNNKTHTKLKISKLDPYNLYLAYHEGWTGYKRKSFNKKPRLLKIARKVERQGKLYSRQLNDCEKKFRCRQWYKIWPFCD